MKKIIIKFGGSVLRDSIDIKKLAMVINAYNKPVVVVVSAFHGITDRLTGVLNNKKITERPITDIVEDIRGIHYGIIDDLVSEIGTIDKIKAEVNTLLENLKDQLTGIMLIGDIPVLSKAYILSFGERISSVVIAGILNHMGCSISHVSPEAAKIYTRGPVLNASLDLQRSSPGMKRSFSGRQNYIVPGFYGISDMERTSLFGRGGSDYSAAGIAAGINAESCDLWKDVDGFMTADPAVTENALKIPLLSYGEAAELSYFGAGITHPETFSPLKLKNIPLKIFNTRQLNGNRKLPLPSTIISSSSIKSRDVIKSISGSTGFSVLRVKGSGVGIHPGIISTISNQFSRDEINIRSIITSQTTINFLLSSEDIEAAYSIVEGLNLPDAEEISTDTDIALIAAVGEGFRNTYGVAARILQVLSDKKINVSLVTAGASDEAIYFTIKKEECDNAVQLLHKEFFE